MYIKNKCELSPLLGTVNFCTLQRIGHSFMLEPQYFGHLSCFTISSLKYAKFWNFDPFLNKIATFFYGPSITNKDDHFTKNHIKIG